MSENIAIEKLYEYRANTQSSPVIQGRAEFIERFIPQPEMQRIFGGFIRSRDWDAGQEYLGVWGARKISRFRRILRERGASFVVEHCESPPFKIGVVRDGTA